MSAVLPLMTSPSEWDKATHAMIARGVLKSVIPTRPPVPAGFRELAIGEDTRFDDLVWVGGQGPWSQLHREDLKPGYAYKPQTVPNEIGHFMHVRRLEKAA